MVAAIADVVNISERRVRELRFVEAL